MDLIANCNYTHVFFLNLRGAQCPLVPSIGQEKENILFITTNNIITLQKRKRIKEYNVEAHLLHGENYLDLYYIQSNEAIKKIWLYFYQFTKCLFWNSCKIFLHACSLFVDATSTYSRSVISLQVVVFRPLPLQTCSLCPNTSPAFPWGLFPLTCSSPPMQPFRVLIPHCCNGKCIEGQLGKKLLVFLWWIGVKKIPLC